MTDEQLDALHRELTRKAVETCSDCGGSGLVTVIEGDEPSSRRCACRRRVDHLVRLAAAEVPREFWTVADLVLEWNRDKQEAVTAYCGNLAAAREHGLGFLMTGENGVGKTVCACTVLDAALRQGYSAHYVTFHTLLARIRRGQRDWMLRDALDEALRCDFLVLDELGKEGAASQDAYVVSELDAVLRQRRHNLLPTVVVTNLEADRVGDVYGASVDSLISDRMRVLTFRPGDFRKRGSAHETWARLLGGDTSGE